MMTPSSSGNLTASHRRHRRPLHNFSFPNLNWGSHRLLRCKIPPTAATTSPEAAAAAVNSPWNLRTRKFRSSCKAPHPPFNSNHHHHHHRQHRRSVSPDKAKKKEEEEEGLVKELTVSLSKEEIEEDLVRMKGLKPQRRSKKRTRTVQKMLDKLFPGLWLYDIMADSYKTND